MMRIGAIVDQVTGFIAERLPLDKMSYKSLVAKKEVPLHRMSWAYYMGGLTMFFLLIQVVTGLMLLFYYKPTVSEAHASVELITEHVTGGALIRNLHAWSSSFMIACVLVHMLTTFAMKAFDKPRELTWITGVLLLFITFGFGFTGYLLPWNQIAVNATKVGLQSVEELGHYLPGQMSKWPTLLRETFQGEASIGQSTLSRFYVLHVVILPLVLAGTLSIHLLSVQLHGMSQGVDEKPTRFERFFPFFILKDFKLWGAIFLGVFIVALCLPFEAFFAFPLAEPFNALGSTPEGIKPEWYFYFVYYPLELLPFWVVLLSMTVVKAGLFLTPWIFRGTSRRTLRLLAIAAATYLIVITLFGQDIYNAVKGVK
ncbi:MAG: cytochrome bc complex cytochrome b subunit [Candidatus Sumerlaeaceae bacterium]|nr:cytochrome bc complex cytochrome b subunit [Candidatus Sumerlaeaceae bacterium]